MTTTPLHWSPMRMLDDAPPADVSLELDAYDFWHFRRLGAHAPELADLLKRAPALAGVAFDLYGMLYKPSPRVRERARNARTRAFVDHLERSGTLSALRARTVLDEWATVIALPALLGALLGGEDHERPDAGSGEREPSSEELSIASNAALSRIAEQWEAAEQVMSILRDNDTWGRGRGAGRELPLPDLLRLGELIARDRHARAVLDMAGRWAFAMKRRPRRIGAGKGREEVWGVELGPDLARLVASERVLLAHPIARRVVLARAIERRALVTAMRGPSTQGKGPVIALVDTSGSMGSERSKLAKSLCTALALRCGETRRPLHVLTFGGPGELHETSFVRATDFVTRLHRCLSMTFGAGTDFDGPLRRVCELVTTAPWSSADALVVTDGFCEVSAPVRELLAKTKRRTDLEILGVLVGKGTGLNGLADAIFDVDDRAVQADEPRAMRLVERIGNRI